MIKLSAKRLRVIALAAVAAGATIATGGCSVKGMPRIRTGSYATATLGTNFIDANELGRHSYKTPLYERNGIAYTCRGGHIDIAHVRIAADDVRYLYNMIGRNLLKASPEFSFKASEEPSIYFVHFDYPDNWKSLTQEDKRTIADELALELSQYFSYTMTTWHEVLTWFGYKSTGIFPEFPSAFSWEDNYSNVVGTRVGAEAIQDDKHDYDTAMTIAVKKELEKLGVQSSKTAKQASEKMKGKWWEGTPFLVYVDMRERNMDLGYVDGYVMPTLVPGVCEGAKPLPYPAPTVKLLSKYGFKMKFEVEPKEFERDKILRIVYPDGKGKRIQLAEQLPLIMARIREEAIGMGYNTMPPRK